MKQRVLITDMKAAAKLLETSDVWDVEATGL